MRCLDLISWEQKVVTSINASHPRRRGVGQRRTPSAGITWGGRAGNGPGVSRGSAENRSHRLCRHRDCFKGLAVRMWGPAPPSPQGRRARWPREGLTVRLRSKAVRAERPPTSHGAAGSCFLHPGILLLPSRSQRLSPGNHSDCQGGFHLQGDREGEPRGENLRSLSYLIQLGD